MSAAVDDGRVLTIARSFRASPSQVYAAWTDPEALPRWFGPDDHACRTHAIDVRVGGEWRFTMTGDGRDWPNRHRWTALVPPEEGRAGRIEFLMDGVDGDEPKRVVVTLEPEGTGTRLTQRMTFPSVEAADFARSYDAEAKGGETLTKLARHLGE